MTPPPRRKLIEVSLPLEKINAESAREKSIRHGHPSTLHLWWARRPLAAARAVLFAQLVDDPSCRPEALAIEDDAEREAWITAERDRLHRLIEELVVWENTTDEALFARAHAEILRDTDGAPPPVLDPFAGGGSIPLEAQRLGLEAHASDLNPVAVLINKALIEIPPKFAGRPPVFPGAAESRLGDWPRATGLAEDVRRYGQWMRDEAEKRIGHLYPDAELPDGTRAPVIAWIWARTVTCPNPACGIEMPLVRSWWLGKKKGKEAYVVPVVEDGPTGRRVRFDIGHDPKNAPTPTNDGTVGRTGATCISCATAVGLEHVRSESRRVGLGQQLMAVVAEGARRRLYLAPSSRHEQAALLAAPNDVPQGPLPPQALGFRVQAYGFKLYCDLFTRRQLTALHIFTDLVGEARDRVVTDATAVTGDSQAGSRERSRSASEGIKSYADAVATYLSFGASKATDYHNALCSWRSDPKNEGIGHLFSRQAIPMVWDYCEGNPLSQSSGNIRDQFTWVSKAIDRLPAKPAATSRQVGAQFARAERAVISTDPPYYDNIGYSDLSDFFYVWLRRSLREAHPALLSTLLTPKADELVANPFRHGGNEGAMRFFEQGFAEVFTRARETARDDYPITVYYAFKQSESEMAGEASTGWETLLGSVVRAGWSVTATWPMRSELGNRLRSIDSNALASSIVLALRPRPADAPTIDRRGLLAALRAELPDALRELQQGAIAPVDLPQAAIGPGMAVFTRYSAVLGNDGTPMSVREALQQINHLLDEVLSEQEGDFDPDTRFLLTWFKQHGFANGKFGDAENMATGRGASLSRLTRAGALTSHAGAVKVIAPADLPADWDPATDPHLTVWEVVLHLSRVLAADGVPAAAALYRAVPSSLDLVLAKELTSLLFRLAEQRRDSGTAQLFNALGSSWNEIAKAATGRSIPAAGQLEFPDTDDED